MDTLIDRTPQIIAEAAKNPLALAALVVLAVSALSYLFFRNASQNAKLFIFIPMAASFILIVLVLADADKNRRSSWPDRPEPVPPSRWPPAPDIPPSRPATPARVTPHPSSIGGIGLGARVEAVRAKLPVNTDANGNLYAIAPVKVTYGRGPNATVLNAGATYHFVEEQVREIETDIKLDQERCGTSSRAQHLASATDADWGIPVEAPQKVRVPPAVNIPVGGEVFSLKFRKDGFELEMMVLDAHGPLPYCRITLLYRKALP